MGGVPKQRGALVDFDTGERFDFQFNPGTWNTSKKANYEEINVPGYSEPIYHYGGGSGKTLSCTLMMDALEEGDDITRRVSWLEAYTYSDLEDGARLEPPPVFIALGAWNRVVRIISVGARYTLWRVDSTPCRVEVDLEFVEVTDISTPRSVPFLEASRRATTFKRK